MYYLKLNFRCLFVLQRVLTSSSTDYTINGILSVEYNGQPQHVHDGLCVTLLVSICSNDMYVARNGYVWKAVDAHLKDTLNQLLEPFALPGLLL